MRRHRSLVISVAAVCLALAVGVVAGSVGLSGTTVSGLRDDKGGLQNRIDDLRAEIETLDRRLSAADDFDTRLSGRMVRDALAGKSVLLFRAPDAQDSDVDAVSRLIGQAGGTLTGIIGLTAEFAGGDSGEKLRSVVNSPIVPAGAGLDAALLDPGAQAGDLLGIALLINRDPAILPAADAARETVLAALRDTGFLSFDGTPAAADTAVVLTGGALAEDAGNQGATVARFAAALAPHGSGTVLAGRDAAGSAVSAVAVARADPALSTAISTVDDIGAESGRITTVLALRALLDGGAPQRYGTGPGADAVTVPQ